MSGGPAKKDKASRAKKAAKINAAKSNTTSTVVLVSLTLTPYAKRGTCFTHCFAHPLASNPQITCVS